jgi:FkbM family methyltransferase
MNPRYLVSRALVGIAKFLTRGSDHIEEIYYKLYLTGLLWIVLMRVVKILKIDQVILVPAGSKLLPIPLFMSSSERSVIDVFKPKLGDVVIDVGTYYGRYTLMASDYVGESGLVIGVEADSKNYSITQKNIKINRKTNVLLFRSAASEDEGTIKLFKTKYSGTHSIVWNSLTEFETVPCTTIDNIIDKLVVKKVDWLKIDVEGAELLVLKGSRKTLVTNNKLKLVIEIHTDSNEVIRFLEGLGYRVIFLEQKSHIPYHILALKGECGY